MRCTVLLFAQLAEVVGARSLTIEVAEGGSVGDAVEEVARRYEAVAPMLDQVAVAVDEQYCRRDAPLPDGCTLALIPPVSGG